MHEWGDLMNKLIKRMTAALTALACVPVMGMTAKADKMSYYWGTATWDAFAELEPYDDHGMYSRSQMGKEQLFLRKSSNDTGSIIFVTPRTNTVCFVLRDDVDVDAAADQIAEIVDAYIPGIRDGKVTWESNPESWHIYSCAQAQLFNTGFGGIRTYSLELEDVIPDKASVEAGILLGLAKKHLISEFYGWGQTADYYTGYVNQTDLGDIFLLSYSPTHTIENPDPNNGKGNWLTVETDWDAVQGYLDDKPIVRMFVVLKEEGDEEEYRRRITELITDNLSVFSIPKDIRFIDEIPRTNLQKVDFMKLSQFSPEDKI